MDKMTKEQRHRCMAAIRGRDTRPEMLVRHFLFSRGFRYRLNDARLPGRPDLVLPRYRTVIFVNGCFWHGHDGCRYFVIPKTNTDFWLKKINRNRQRDEEVLLKLRRMKWHCITVWECQLKPAVRQHTLDSLVYTLSHTFLEDRRVKKSYTADDAPTEIMAAESEVIYKYTTTNSH